MITEFRIFDPKNLILSDAPSSNDLFCDFEINLDDKSIQFESVQLKELISMLNEIAETSTYYGTDKYSFSLTGKSEYKFKWNREDNSSANHLLVIESNELELGKKRIWTGHFHGSHESFFLRIMKELLEAELYDFAMIYGDLFFKKYPGIEHKYRIADKVRTVINENVKNKKAGFYYWQMVS